MAFRRLQYYIPNAKNPKFFYVGLLIFFFVIFDGLIMYLAPVIMTNAGISVSLMGIIVGSSSIAGMILDFFLCGVLKITHYRRMFLLMLILAGSCPFFLFGGTTVTIYFILSAMWGFYYDFYNVGTLDFVERTDDPEKHVSNFGFLRSFEGAGYLLAPFIGSIVLLLFHPGPQMIIALLIPLFIAFLFYIIIKLRPIVEKKEYDGVTRKNPLTFLKEMALWEKVGIFLFPVLLLTLVINLIDAAIWTFGPIFSEQVGTINGISGGAFMTAYTLPPILVGAIVGTIASKFGNIHTAQWAIALGSVFLVFIGYVTSPLILIILMFSSSFCFAIGWPAINAIYTQHVKKASARRKEIETVQDLFTNFGDVAGPIIGGYMAQYLGFSYAFTALGIMGVVVSVILFIVTPKTVA